MGNMTDELASDYTHEMDGRLNIAERMVARVGAWAGSLAVRRLPSAVPFFLSEGRVSCASAYWEQDGTDQQLGRPL